MRIAITEAHGLVRAAMRTTGYDECEATEIADHLTDCELRGLSFGGLARALSVAERIQSTAVPPAANPDRPGDTLLGRRGRG